MPLSEKSHWKYLVRAVDSYTDLVTVSRRIAVGDTYGYELKSNLGISHLGWSHGNLITDQLAGAKLMPALSLLSPGKPSHWSGWIEWGDTIEPGKAETTILPAKKDSPGSLAGTTCSNVLIKLPSRTMEIRSWFKSGLGLVRQEQRTNGRVDVLLEYLDQSY